MRSSPLLKNEHKFAILAITAQNLANYREGPGRHQQLREKNYTKHRTQTHDQANRTNDDDVQILAILAITAQNLANYREGPGRHQQLAIKSIQNIQTK